MKKNKINTKLLGIVCGTSVFISLMMLFVTILPMNGMDGNIEPIENQSSQTRELTKGDYGFCDLGTDNTGSESTQETDNTEEYISVEDNSELAELLINRDDEEQRLMREAIERDSVMGCDQQNPNWKSFSAECCSILGIVLTCILAVVAFMTIIVALYRKMVQMIDDCRLSHNAKKNQK